MSTYTVKAGDTLWSIAKNFSTTVGNLVGLNNIKDANYITVGQVLQTSGTASGVTPSATSRATIDTFGLQSNSSNTLYASWTWTKEDTDHHEVMWTYDTGDGVWFIGTDGTATHYEELNGGQSTYSIPANATQVKFKVKPVAKTKSKNGKETSPWTASWSTEKVYNVKDLPPAVPSVPSMSIEKLLLEAEIDNLGDLNADTIQFQVVQDNTETFKTSNTSVHGGVSGDYFNYVRYTCYVNPGHEYKVRARSKRGSLYSEWSNFSSSVSTIPETPAVISVCRATSETSIYLEWPTVKTAKTYDLEYTTKREYFDGSDQTTMVSGIQFAHYEKTGLESGQEYFFRVRAVNGGGESSWSQIRSIIIGKPPAAPTTWSSTTTAIVGESMNLYWVHNSEDESSQTSAELEISINGASKVYTIPNEATGDDKDKTSVCPVDTSEYYEGTRIQWRVRTAGVTGVYGEWSIQRTIDIYAPPTLMLSVSNSADEAFELLESFPIRVRGTAGPNTQTPIGYHLSVVSNEIYETVDRLGNAKTVVKGEKLYSRYFDISESLDVTLSANDLDLENNITYAVMCTVSMDSGLTAESSVEFKVSWSDEQYEPNCEIAIDTTTYTASIRPYCADPLGNLLENVVLSVYRREFDGRFTELGSNIDNMSNTFITDPHPALDYARYRIVATSTLTGAVSYYDVPGYPVGGDAIIIQWDEAWQSFYSSEETGLEQPEWAGSMLRLPYNIDVSTSNKPDVTHVEYIGRSHPIAYYGTHLGHTYTWNVDIDKNDEETLHALRRLSNWLGDVYVREPSGSGYWASITVSFTQTHGKVTIPVSLNITRVEGGA